VAIASAKDRALRKGQTETVPALPPGKYMPHLAASDGNHIPCDPALAAKKNAITVK